MRSDFCKSEDGVLCQKCVFVAATRSFSRCLVTPYVAVETVLLLWTSAFSHFYCDRRQVDYLQMFFFQKNRIYTYKIYKDAFFSKP